VSKLAEVGLAQDQPVSVEVLECAQDEVTRLVAGDG